METTKPRVQGLKVQGSGGVERKVETTLSVGVRV